MDLQTLKETIKGLNFKNHADIRAAAALPEILDAMCDAIANGGGAKPLVLTGTIPTGYDVQDGLAAVGLTIDAYRDLLRGKYSCVIDGNGSIYAIHTNIQAASYTYVVLLKCGSTGKLDGFYFKGVFNNGWETGTIAGIDSTAKNLSFDA